MQNLGEFYATSDFDCECLWNKSRYLKSEKRDQELFLPHLAKKSDDLFDPLTRK